MYICIYVYMYICIYVYMSQKGQDSSCGVPWQATHIKIKGHLPPYFPSLFARIIAPFLCSSAQKLWDRRTPNLQ